MPEIGSPLNRPRLGITLAQDRPGQSEGISMSDAQAYLIGGESDGDGINERVFKLRRQYGRGKWKDYEHIDLGSGLIGHSQKMTVAARAMAEKKTVGHRS